MDRVFSHLIGKKCASILVVKSQPPEQHSEDLADIFVALRKFNLRLNLAKCMFGVNEGKFLDLMLTQRGIETNLEKCKSIIEMGSPANIKEIQRLIGRLTTISRFFPKLVDNTRPMIQLLKKSEKFACDEEYQEMFEEVK